MEPHSESSATEAWPVDAVEVARIIDAWGVKGWIKLQPFASDPQALFAASRWHIQPAAHAAAASSFPPQLNITQVKPHGDAIVACARELGDREAARALRGARVFVARSQFPSAGDDAYYWVDLIGSQVVNRQGEALGEVSALIDTGPHSVLCVRRPEAGPEVPDAQAERLIPFVAAYVDTVDTAARRIQVDWALDD